MPSCRTHILPIALPLWLVFGAMVEGCSVDCSFTQVIHFEALPEPDAADVSCLEWVLTIADEVNKTGCVGDAIHVSPPRLDGGLVECWAAPCSVVWIGIAERAIRSGAPVSFLLDVTPVGTKTTHVACVVTPEDMVGDCEGYTRAAFDCDRGRYFSQSRWIFELESNEDGGP